MQPEESPSSPVFVAADDEEEHLIVEIKEEVGPNLTDEEVRDILDFLEELELFDSPFDQDV